MLKRRIEKTLNKQINTEFRSVYLYLSMSTYFESTNLSGFANWARIQAQEELTHAMRFYRNILEQGGRMMLSVIYTVPTTWKSPLNVYKETYKHEQKVTGLKTGHVDLSISDKDHTTNNNMLQWFIDEQVGEETSADAVIQQLKLIGKDDSGLFMINREMNKHVFIPPADN